MARLGRRQPNRPIIYRPRPVAGGGATTPPTYPASADLVEGTGTRSFAVVTTQAGDYLVVEVISSNNLTADGLFTPSCTGLSFGSPQTNSGTTGGGVDTLKEQWAVLDSVGGSRTVQLAPAAGATAYRARVTVVRGSAGPGTGNGTDDTAATMSITRQGDHSGMFMLVGDWSTGAVGSPAWTPGGTTVASQQGTSATYIFGRWDDSGTAGTASHGISSPSYTTPSVAVLEMLGTSGGGATTWSLAGTAASTSAAAGAFGPVAIAGTAVSTSTTTGVLGTLFTIAGSAASTSASTGDVTRVSAIAGTAASTSAAAGALVALAVIAGAAVSTSSTTGGFGAIAIAGTAASTSAAAGGFGGALPLAGTAVSTSTSTGALVAVSALAGSALSTSASTGVLVLIGRLAGGAVSTSSASGGFGAGQIAGTAASTSAATGAITMLAVLTGSASSTSATVGALTRIGGTSLAGTAASLSTAVAAITMLGRLAGAAASTSTATGDVSGYAPITVRPYTGVTARPGTGATLRPYAGTTARP